MTNCSMTRQLLKIYCLILLFIDSKGNIIIYYDMFVNSFFNLFLCRGAVI